MDLLVLGGTGFLGKAVASLARERGLSVTTLARGGRPAPEGVELMVGDRSQPDGLAAVTDRHWDAVVDVSSQPGQVRAAIEQVGADHWVYVSSASVYARADGAPADESGPVREPLQADTFDDMADYGAAKSACEDVVRTREGTATIVRAALIGGPGDDTGRGGYYVWRFAHPTGPDVLVPADLDFPTAVLDVDDLADWIVTCAVERVDGTFNAAAPWTTLNELLRVSRAVAGPAAPGIRPVPAEIAEREGVAGWMGPKSLPLWIADPDWRWTATLDTTAAEAHGFRTRPLQETLERTLAFEEQRESARQAGLTDDEERALRSALPPVPAVFLHGVGGAGPAAWPAQAGLAAGRECVFVERLAPGDDPDGIIDWVGAAVRDRIHLVGHSYGGAVAMLLAAARTERVASLILIDPAAFAICPRAPHTAAHIAAVAPVFARADDPRVDFREFSSLFAQAMGSPPPPLPDDELKLFVAHLRALRPPWELAVDASVVARIPTLVVVGDADPMYAEVGSALARQGAEVVEHAGFGHRPHDDPAITDRIAEHWRRAEEVA